MPALSRATSRLIVVPPGMDDMSARLRDMGAALSEREAAESPLIEYDQRDRAWILSAVLFVFFGTFGVYLTIGLQREGDGGAVMMLLLWSMFGAFMAFLLYILHASLYGRTWFLLSPGGVTVLHYAVMGRIPKVTRIDVRDMDGIVLTDMSNANGKSVWIRLKNGRAVLLASDTSSVNAAELHSLLKTRYCRDR